MLIEVRRSSLQVRFRDRIDGKEFTKNSKGKREVFWASLKLWSIFPFCEASSRSKGIRSCANCLWVLTSESSSGRGKNFLLCGVNSSSPKRNTWSTGSQNLEATLSELISEETRTLCSPRLKIWSWPLQHQASMKISQHHSLDLLLPLSSGLTSALLTLLCSSCFIRQNS